MTIPAEPKYSDADIRELAEQWIAAKDRLPPLSPVGLTRRKCADELLALLASCPSTPDKAGVSDADLEVLLNRAANMLDRAAELGGNPSLRNARHACAAELRDALTHFRSHFAEAVRDGERLDWVIANGDHKVQGSDEKGWSVFDCNNGLIFVVRNAPTCRAAIDAAMQEQSHD